MAKFFDLIPPQPKPKELLVIKKRKKGGWLFLIIILIFGVFGFYKMPFLETFKSTKSDNTPDAPSASTDNFELFNETNNSNLTEETPILVRILNASGKDEPLSKVQKLLLAGNVNIEQSGAGTNTYDQTIIYYKKDKLAQGQKIADILKNDFSVKLQESESLGETYNVLVIMGNK